MYVDLEELRQKQVEAETDGILEWQCCMSFILPLSIPFVASLLHIRTFAFACHHAPSQE